MINILNSETTNPQPGQIWQLDIQEFSRKDKLLFENLYVLILNETEIDKFKAKYIQEKDSESRSNGEHLYYRIDTRSFHQDFKSMFDQKGVQQPSKYFKSYRILLLSKLTNYALDYDLIFSEPLISFTKRDVVAHMHICTLLVMYLENTLSISSGKLMIMYLILSKKQI